MLTIMKNKASLNRLLDFLIGIILGTLLVYGYYIAYNRGFSESASEFLLECQKVHYTVLDDKIIACHVIEGVEFKTFKEDMKK